MYVLGGIVLRDDAASLERRIQPVRPSPAASPKRTVIVDAGPLRAAIDRGDVDHAWAVRVFRAVPARYITFGAAISTALIQPVFRVLRLTLCAASVPPV